MNIGKILIIASLFASTASAFFYLFPPAVQKRRSPGDIAFFSSSMTVFLSAVILMVAFIANDFSFAYVFDNSSRELSVFYRIAAFWAGKEGSFLLWLCMLSGIGLIIIKKSNDQARYVVPLIILNQVFILFILVLESPFNPVWEKYTEMFQPGMIPPNGSGLNPLLIDPWMISHPPILFLGYSSAVVPFAYVVSSLARKDYESWIPDARPWLLFSFTSLGLGIFLGGYWAYKVLGWGGYWGWDSVENSSLIPWLIACALVHGVLLQKRKGSLARTSMVFSLVYLLLVFYSTFLTRSGVLANFSVHSFEASGTLRTIVAWTLLALSCGSFTGIFLFFLHKNNKAISSNKIDDSWSWQTMILYGIILLSFYSLIILLGTSMPILSGLIFKNPIPVTENFYNNFSIPFGAFILLLMAISTAAVLKRELVSKTSIMAGFTSIIISLMFHIILPFHFVSFILIAISLFLIASSIIDLVQTRSSVMIPSRLTHLGTGTLVLGIVVSSFFSDSHRIVLVQNHEVKAGPYTLLFKGLSEEEKPRLQFLIEKSGGKEKISTAYYPNQKTRAIYKEPYIKSTLFEDFYLAPDLYESNSTVLTNIQMSKGEEKNLGDLKILFKGFSFTKMGTPEAILYADLTINGQAVTPGIKIQGEENKAIEANIPGTNRKAALLEVNATERKINLYISPDTNTPLPPDRVIVEITYKRLILLVWLGAALVFAGSSWGFYRSRKN